jgi:hypothetical protein
MEAIGPRRRRFEGKRMSLGNVDQPLISPVLASRDNGIGAAKRIGFAEREDRRIGRKPRRGTRHHAADRQIAQSPDVLAAADSLAAQMKALRAG